MVRLGSCHFVRIQTGCYKKQFFCAHLLCFHYLQQNYLLNILMRHMQDQHQQVNGTQVPVCQLKLHRIRRVGRFYNRMGLYTYKAHLLAETKTILCCLEGSTTSTMRLAIHVRRRLTPSLSQLSLSLSLSLSISLSPSIHLHTFYPSITYPRWSMFR